MTDIVKGMARAWWQSHDMKEGEGPLDFVIDEAEVKAMRAALMWLADNVSKEMSVAFWNEFYREYRTGGQAETVNALAAAIRAAGEEGK